MVPIPNMDSSFERILGGKKRKRQDVEAPTFSFDINLVPYSENVFAEYSWKDLVEKCQDRDKEHLEINTPLKPKASKKHKSPTPKKKKRRKKDDELEYDVDDPFIDDEEQTDEEIPEEFMTARGGFYINTGNLILIKKPINIFDEDTEEMMDKLDDMDDNVGDTDADTEPEGEVPTKVDNVDEGGEDEVTLTQVPSKPKSQKAKVAVKKAFVKVKKVKTLSSPTKVKKVKKVKLEGSEKPKKIKAKKLVDSSNKENIDQQHVTKLSTPKKVEDKKVFNSTPNKKEILTPKKQIGTTTPKKVKTPNKKLVATPSKEKSSPKKKVKSDSSSTSPKKKVKTTAKKLVKAVRKKILPSQLPDMTDYDQKIMAIVSKTENSWKCLQCPHEHELKANVLVHAEQHLTDIVLQCVLCDKAFNMKRPLKQHVLKNHLELNSTTKAKKKTKIEGGTATKKTVKTTKKVGKDGKIVKKINKSVAKKVVSPNQLCDTQEFDAKVAELVEKSEDKWKCRACDNTSETKALVLKHAEQHVEGFTLPCLQCDKTFTMKRVLKQHIYTKHKDSVKPKEGKKVVKTKKENKGVTKTLPKPKVKKTDKAQKEGAVPDQTEATTVAPSQS